MENKELKYREIRFLGFWAFGSLLLMLISRWWGNNLLSQLGAPAFISPGIDNTFWIMHALKIPQTIMRSEPLKIFIDIYLFTLTIACMVIYKKRIPSILLVIVLFIYIITQQSFTANHTKTAAALCFIVLPFCVPIQRFDYVWNAVRYYLLFVMASAALFKLFNGALFNIHHFSDILFLQHLDLRILEPKSLIFGFSEFLIHHNWLAYILFLVLFITQLSFIVGFFTKKYDRILLLLLGAFLLLTYMIMRIQNFDLLILGVTLIKSRDINFTND